MLVRSVDNNKSGPISYFTQFNGTSLVNHIGNALESLALFWDIKHKYHGLE